MDTVLRRSIAGFVATIIAVSVNWILYLFRVLPSTTSHYAAISITPPGTLITNFSLLLGVLTNLVAGTFGGVGLASLFNWTGNDYSWLKGIGIAAIWGLVAGLMLKFEIGARVHD